ncbi:MAG: hypothetical protein WC977_01485 [Anaerovoracaceae bacterium]
MDHEMIERVAAKHGLSTDDAYEVLFAALDEAEVSAAAEDVQRVRLSKLLRELLRLRLANPRGFDAFALKVLFPRLTHAEVARIISMIGHALWSNRARSCEVLRAMLEAFPELRTVLSWDTRGAATKTRRRKPEVGNDGP